MGFLLDLWLPILVSAVAVFVASSIIWMKLPMHKKDFTPPPNEEEILGAISRHKFTPGQYYLPWCQGRDMNDPAMQERLKRGPWAMLIVSSGAPNFGKSLGLWFVSVLIVSVLVAYGAAAAIGTGAPVTYLHVFQVVGSMALLGHAGMVMHDSIWKCVPWRITLTRVFDGVVYALITAGIFAAMWPTGAAGVA